MPRDTKSVLAIYHRQGLSAQEAHEAIQRFPGETPMSLQDVEQTFKEIEAKKEEEKKEAEKKLEIENRGKQIRLNELTKYLDGMNLGAEKLEKSVLEERRKRMMLALNQKSVQERIITYATLGARISLLQTSQLFRQLSMDMPYSINNFTIEIGNDYFHIHGDNPEQHKTSIQKSVYERTVSVFMPPVFPPKKFTKEEKKEHAATIDCYYQNPEGMLRRLFLFEKLKIGTLTLRGDEFNNQAVKNVLSSRKTPLKVETLMIECRWLGTLEELLPYMDASYLKTIKFDNCSKYEPSYLFFEEFIFQSEQWKNATTFYMKYSGVDEDWKPYAHFSNCKLRFFERDIDIGKLFELKDDLLKNPHLQQFKIVTPYLKIRNFRKLTEAFQVFNPKSPTLIHFDYPGGAKKLSVSLTERYIWFQGPEYVQGDGEDPEDEEKGWD